MGDDGWACTAVRRTLRPAPTESGIEGAKEWISTAFTVALVLVNIDDGRFRKEGFDEAAIIRGYIGVP